MCIYTYIPVSIERVRKYTSLSLLLYIDIYIFMYIYIHIHARHVCEYILLAMATLAFLAAQGADHYAGLGKYRFQSLHRISLKLAIFIGA